MFGLVAVLGIVSVNMGSAAKFEEHNLFCCHLHREDDKSCTFLFTCVLLQTLLCSVHISSLSR